MSTQQQRPAPANGTHAQHAQHPGATGRGDPIAQLLQDTRPYVRKAAHDLSEQIATLEALLPRHLHGQAPRLIQVALATISRDDKLKDCPTEQFLRCVFDAASIGLAIDGKRGYIVNFKGKYDFLADYKALIDLARTNGVIKDCYPVIVYEADKFEIGQRDGKDLLNHEIMTRGPRGNVLGAYAKVILPCGSWRIEWMDIGELQKVEAMAPSKKGPWATWKQEMQKKTVARRAMKLYCSDPTYAKAMREPWERDDSFTPDDYLETLPARDLSQQAAGALGGSAEPPTGPVEDTVFVANMQKREWHLVNEKLCEPGEYLAALTAEGHRAGWPQRLENWPAGEARATFATDHFKAFRAERLDAKKDAPTPGDADEPPAHDSGETIEEDTVWINWLRALITADCRADSDVFRHLALPGSTKLTDLTYVQASAAGSWLTNGRETKPPVL